MLHATAADDVPDHFFSVLFCCVLLLATQVALFAEWRCGAALAALADEDALAAAARWEAHDAAGRAAVAALLPRWRAASALFGGAD
jgi:hypothetical protein